MGREVRKEGFRRRCRGEDGRGRKAWRGGNREGACLFGTQVQTLRARQNPVKSGRAAKIGDECCLCSGDQESVSLYRHMLFSVVYLYTATQAKLRMPLCLHTEQAQHIKLKLLHFYQCASRLHTTTERVHLYRGTRWRDIEGEAFLSLTKLLRNYITHSRIVQTWSASPAAIAGVRFRIRSCSSRSSSVRIGQQKL